MTASRVIWVDSEVKRLLDEERLPTERNYSATIIRLIQRADERERVARREPGLRPSNDACARGH